MSPDSQQPTPTPVTPSPQPGVSIPNSGPTFTPTPPPTPAPQGPPSGFMPGSTQMPQAPMSVGKKTKMSLLVGVLVAVLLLGGGVAYGSYLYVSNTPDNLMKAAVGNLKNEKAFAGTFDISSNETSIIGDFAVNTDASNSKNADFILGIGTDETRVAANILAVDGSAYVKFSNMENLGPLLASFSSQYATLKSPQVATLFRNINDQWFELDKSDVKSLAQTGGNDNVEAAPTPDDLKKVLTIYDQHPFIKVDKTYSDEVVDGSGSAHFSVKIDKNEEVAFMQALKNANISSIQVTDEDIAKVKNASDTSTSTLEIWIARDTKKFKRIVVTGKEGSKTNKVTLTLKNQLPTFEKFEKPADVRPLSDFSTLLLGPSYRAN